MDISLYFWLVRLYTNLIDREYERAIKNRTVSIKNSTRNVEEAIRHEDENIPDPKPNEIEIGQRESDSDVMKSGNGNNVDNGMLAAEITMNRQKLELTNQCTFTMVALGACLVDLLANTIAQDYNFLALFMFDASLCVTANFLAFRHSRQFFAKLLFCCAKRQYVLPTN